mmetsp:Transcript_1267/g.2747  ORF Transcript_1267/g.2747 Transcript_1267/m.2747 type:complete len:210 (-) Transcript_1267:1417-2046(-)
MYASDETPHHSSTRTTQYLSFLVRQSISHQEKHNVQKHRDSKRKQTPSAEFVRCVSGVKRHRGKVLPFRQHAAAQVEQCRERKPDDESGRSGVVGDFSQLPLEDAKEYGGDAGEESELGADAFIFLDFMYPLSISRHHHIIPQSNRIQRKCGNDIQGGKAQNVKRNGFGPPCDRNDFAIVVVHGGSAGETLPIEIGGLINVFSKVGSED